MRSDPPTPSEPWHQQMQQHLVRSSHLHGYETFWDKPSMQWEEQMIEQITVYADLQNLGNLNPTHLEYFFDIAWHGVSWWCDDLAVEVIENIKKFMILDNCKGTIVTGNPKRNFHPVLMRRIWWPLGKSDDGARASRSDVVAFTDMPHEVAGAIVMTCAGYRHGWLSRKIWRLIWHQPIAHRCSITSCK